MTTVPPFTSQTTRRSWLRCSSWAIATWLVTVGCSQLPSATVSTTDTATNTTEGASAAPVTLTISAAASLQDVMQAVQATYQDVAPEVTLTYTFGSSGSLAQQIAQGAPSDLFVSASQQWMDELETQGHLLAGTRRDLLQNSMVLVVPQGTTAIADIQDLETATLDRMAIGEPESVPAGRYAKEVLTSLGVFEALQPKLVFGKDVRQVLSYIATGNVDAGLVYATDAATSDQVQVAASVPPQSHSPIVYPLAIVQDSANTQAAQALAAFLATDTAADIFQEYGFAVAE